MGRRPNAVVAEFFERGAKLEDSSNRYQHTCRQCGELFPKGRVDNLVNHLMKRCPNVTQDHRNAILLHIQQTPISGKDDSSNTQLSQQPMNAINRTSLLPISLERQQSALDTLAEVSRRHLDYSSQRNGTYDQAQNAILHDADQALAEQALWAQLQQHNISMSTTQQGPEVFDMQLPRVFEQDHQQMHGLDQTFTSSDFTPSLLRTAGDSQQQGGGSGELAGLAALDPQLGPVVNQPFDIPDNQIMTIDNAREDTGTQMDQSPGTKEAIRWATHLTNLAPQDAFASAPADHQLTRAKQRGRFSEDRRKQVQEIRKRGACIRCRMLKKPCSEGTPCSTCANVDSARLWKGQCLRTRLADEFTAWSSEYFHAICQSRVQAAAASSRAPRHHDKVYAKLEVDAVSAGLLLDATISTKCDASAVMDPSLPAEQDRDSIEFIVSLDNRDNLADIIAAYLMSEEVLAAAINGESHTFLRTTLQHCVDLLSSQDSEQPTSDQTKTNRADARTCYNLAVAQTRDALELWILTACLTSSTPCFKINRVSFVPSLDDTNYDLVQAQLLAAIEARAARLSKKVLNDLERRLLQRQQVSGFATFIAAVVLLSSVERMTAFYQALDPSTDDNTDAIPTDWPINITPRSIWTQGPSFAALLTTLLRMRGLPPQTFEDEHGYLAVLSESPTRLMKLNGSASELQLRALDEERRIALASWLSSCNIRSAEVQSWTDGTSTDWYGSFMAALLVQ